MNDIRISIRLTDEEHKQLKIYAIKNNTSIQNILSNYINKLLAKEGNK